MHGVRAWGKGGGGIAAPLICHLRKRASVICEITLFVGDGFCSFTSDNDSDYVSLPRTPASRWHEQYVRRERPPTTTTTTAPPQTLKRPRLWGNHKNVYREGGFRDPPFASP